MTGGRETRERFRFRRTRSLVRRVWELWAEALRVYRAWWLRIFLIALAVFIPVGLVEAAADSAFRSLNPDQEIEALALISTAALTIATGLLGEVFLAGVIGISLADAREGKLPSLRHIARRIRYLRLILLDLVFAAVTVTGLILLIVPGVLSFVFLGLGGPVVEIEHRRVWGALRRSAGLVRQDFWMVFWVLVPATLITTGLSTGLEEAITATLGHADLVARLAGAVSEALFSPFFAISAVLVTLRLIDRSR